MKIAAVLNAHEVPVLLDTIDSIRTYLTSNILVVADGARKGLLDGVALPAHQTTGFVHGQPGSPYRNMALGLMRMYDLWPDAEWYCYLEYDCLIGSYKVVGDLAALPERVWLLGNDYRAYADVNMRLVEIVLKTRFDLTRYLLGCCMFMRHAFLAKLVEIDFFQRFLWYTNPFKSGFIPLFDAYDINENMYPTLAYHFGGGVRQLAKFDTRTGIWSGDFPNYPMRWKPDLDPAIHSYQEAAVMHPLKTVDHPIREYHRRKRSYVGRSIPG